MAAKLVKTKTPGIYKRGGKRRRFQGVRAGLTRDGRGRG
jgi:hypothetical protein